MARMGLPEDTEDNIYNKHQQLVKKLNLDEETASRSWTTYETIRTNITLEGNYLHWLGCSIFVACRNTLTPTVSQNVVHGNPVSLTSLLRFCELSVMKFFEKMKTWIESENMQADEYLQQKIQKLESNFFVTLNIHKHYFPLFKKIFLQPELDASKHRNRKQRATLCTPMKVFKFTWLLFITLKGKYMSSDNNVVSAYYLLLACFDLVFKNAFLANRRDILNSSFEGLPANWSLPTFFVPNKAPCIISTISQFPNMLADAIYVKEYTITKYLHELMSEGILKGNIDSYTGLLDQENFDDNYANIRKAYDQLILTEGNIDERIFLAESQRQHSLQTDSSTNGTASSLQQDLDDTESDLPMINSTGADIVQNRPETPLTGKRFVGPRDVNESMLATATQSIARLHTVLTGCTASPSESLLAIFKNCPNDPTDNVTWVLERMNEKYLEHFPRQREEEQRKLQLAVTLFYKLLENVLMNENTINKDISPLLAKDVFYECLYLCSLEIIQYSYNSQNKFPWLVEAMEMPALNMVRVIELIVRSKDQLSRDTIKHLSYVEEAILESLMWKSDSIIWEDIKKWGEIPKFQDIALPGNMIYNNTTGCVSTKRSLFSTNVEQSPGPSAVESFQSPINAQVKKQLFPNVKPGQSLLHNNKPMPTHLVVTDHEGNRKLIPLDTTQSAQLFPVSPVPTTPTQEIRPKKTGSHYIICRKFYNLAGVRLEDLCNKLGVTEVDLKRKIWTVFEHSIRKYPDLLMDRHLDQILMCAVYVICKITGNESKSFTEIMKCYRGQPQAKSDIYRNVLINRAKMEDGVQIPERRSNLIDFYNNIYVQFMKNFVVPFSNSQNQGNGDLLLSPLPSVRSLLSSPRQQITKNVFIRPFESPSNPNSNSSHSYYFSRSALKDIKEINKAINGSCITGKRALGDSFGCEQPNKRYANRKMQALIEERKVQTME